MGEEEERHMVSGRLVKNWFRRWLLGSLADDDVIDWAPVERELPVDWRLRKLQEARIRHAKPFLLERRVPRITEPSDRLKAIEARGKVIPLRRKS
jgi:hypothetical protein